MDSLKLVVLFVTGALILIGMNHWQRQRAEAIVREWAQAVGVKLIANQRQWWPRGPFFFSSHAQQVFRIVVCDETGNRRSGWLCVGGYFAGVSSCQVEVKWDP